MDRMRVSVTDLDALRWFYADEDADLLKLILQLRRLMPSSEAMEAGSAFHKALEMAAAGEYKGFAVDGYLFSFDTDAELDLPPIRELKAERVYLVDGCEVTLVGKVDAIHGRRIEDHKFTARFDPDRYLESWQWRCYLDMFDADEFRWNIFEAIESAPKNYLIRNVHPLRMHRYPGIGEDVERAVAAFVSFARDHLPEKFERAAA